MKFDIFNSNTWKPAIIDEISMDRALTNKFCGNLSSMIGGIRSLREKITAGYNLTEEAKAAIWIKENHPVAFLNMDLTIHYPASDNEYVIYAIDQILSMWSKPQEFREKNWRYLVPHLATLNPYITKRGDGFYANYASAQADRNATALTEVTVTGNDAWKLYFSMSQSRANILKSMNELQEKFANISSLTEGHSEVEEDDGPISHDVDSSSDIK